MTDPTPLEQARSLYALLLTETFRCFCRMDGQREQVIRVDTAINLFMTYLAGLAATTPEPARLSAEAFEQVARIADEEHRRCREMARIQPEPLDVMRWVGAAACAEGLAAAIRALSTAPQETADTKKEKP